MKTPKSKKARNRDGSGRRLQRVVRARHRVIEAARHCKNEILDQCGDCGSALPDERRLVEAVEYLEAVERTERKRSNDGDKPQTR